MRKIPFCRLAVVALSSLLACTCSIRAQQPAAPAAMSAAHPASTLRVPLEADQLPQDTIFYVVWRGAPSGPARSANNLLALWDDPDFAPVRSAFAESLLNDSKTPTEVNKAPDGGGNGQGNRSYVPQRETEKPKLTRAEIEEVSSLLENPLTLGYLAEPRHAVPAGGNSRESQSGRSWNGLFLVYNRSGKEELLTKTILRLRASGRELPKMSPVTLAGIPALKIERRDPAGKTSTTYWAENGNYAISANEPRVFETVAALLSGKTQDAPLTQTAAYQEAAPQLGGGVVEFFLRIPSIKDFLPASNGPEAEQKTKQLESALSTLKLESVHAVCARLTLDGAKSRISGAILGDAAPGTLFDLWDEGQTTPASLAFVPNDAISYTEYHVSLLALYRLVKRGFQAAAPQGQAGMADLVEAMAQTRIGMPLPDALGLLSGEFGSVQTSPVLDTKTATYFIGIRDKEASLKLLRALLGERISSERTEGDTTYVKFSLGGTQGNAGVMQYNFFNAAVTPNLILASSRRETLQQEIAHRAASPTLPAAFQAVRAQYPDKVNGLSFFDMQRLDWKALKEKWVTEAAKTPAAFQQSGSAPHARGKTGVTAATPAGAPPAWLVQFDPQVIPRHLHVSTSASWKDSKGIHFDGWME
jgi:hypothetical protein